MAFTHWSVKQCGNLGLISNEQTLSGFTTPTTSIVLISWRVFDAHERAHADEVFKKKFSKLATMCSETKALGYDMLW